MAGCTPAPQDSVVQLHFELSQVTSQASSGRPVTTAATPSPVSPSSLAPTVAPVPTSAPTPTPAPSASVAGGSAAGGGSFGGSAPAGGGPVISPGNYFLGPGGVRLPAGIGDVVSLPPNLPPGAITLFSEGYVPSTLVLGASPPPVTNPESVTVSGPTGSPATLTGVLSPADDGLRVHFIGPTLASFQDTSSVANLPFALTVPADATDGGIVVAVDPGLRPRLGLVEALPQPGASVDVGTLTLTSPGPDEPAPPAPPAGMQVVRSALRIAGLTNVHQSLPVLAVEGSTVPSYAIPGFQWLVAYRAANADSTAASEVVGPPGALPGFLPPPDLSGLPPSLGDNTVLSWMDVGATLYTLTVSRAQVAGPPLWQGATTNPSITLPPGLALAGLPLELRVDAWNADGISIYSVASLPGPRDLHLPADPLVGTGRHSVAFRRY